MPRVATPPRLPRLLFRAFVRHTTAAVVLADIDEEYVDVIRPRTSAWQATRWYWRHIMGSILELRRAAATTPTINALPLRMEFRMDTLIGHLRGAVRTWMQEPAVTAVALLALALGIGANTAIFSVVYGVLLSPLPYPDGDRVMTVWLDNRLQGWHQDVTSYPLFEDWRTANETFVDMAAISTRSDNLTGRGEPERLRVQIVSPTFFDVLGVEAIQGRTFGAADFERDERVVVLSYGLWQRSFGSAADAVGTSIELNGEPHTIVGVMPRGFFYVHENVDFWRLFPLSVTESSRGQLWLDVVGRTRDGVTLEQAKSDMDRVGRQLEIDLPRFNEGYGVNVVPLYDEVVGDVRPALLVLLGAVGMVLLISCANVANLMLARATTRSREMAVRAALGAGRKRLIAQVLTESILLAIVGGALAIALAQLGVQLLRSLEPDLPRLAEVGLHPQVLVFSMVASLATGLLFGMAPAFRSARPDLAEVMGDRGTGDGSSHNGGFRAALVVAEIALAVVLLVGAGLLIRSYAALLGVGPGFDATGVLSFRVSLTGPNYQERADVNGYFTNLMDRLGEIPAVQSVGAVNDLPMATGYSSGFFTIEGQPPRSRSELVEVKMNAASREYFQTLRTPLIAGRFFDANDTVDSERVVIINDAFAAAFFDEGVNPLGQRFLFGLPRFYEDPENPDAELPWFRIVGIVGGVRQRGLDREVEPEVFGPVERAFQPSLNLVLRTAGDPLLHAARVRQEVWAIDPNLPIANLQTLESVVGSTTTVRRFNLTLLGMFSVLAIVLAVTGIYGVMSYWVTRQTRDIGVRMALGARGGDVLGMILRRAGWFVGAGVALGLVGSLALTRLMTSLLYGVSPADPVTFAAVAALLAIVATVASVVPARRASRVDPMTALRQE